MLTNLPAESEHGHAHGHGTGVRWLDIIVGVSAMFISVVSLVVSIEHGKTMERMVQQNEKMVAANTVPFLVFAGSQLDPATNKPLLRLILRNGGVGPALINSFELRYKGAACGTPEALMRACCRAAFAKRDRKRNRIIYSNVSRSILPARETIEVIKLRQDPGDDLMQQFEHARADLTVRACYCSVLGECWQTDFGSQPPQPVKECKPPERSAVLW